jgi:hypothetical protein
MDEHQRIPISGVGSGASNVSQINEAIDKAWQEILTDPVLARDTAAVLGLPLENLPKKPPYSAQPYEGGMGPVETALIIFAYKFVDDVAYDLIKDVTKDAAMQGLKLLWGEVVKERVEEHLQTGGLGPERPVPDDIQ